MAVLTLKFVLYILFALEVQGNGTPSINHHDTIPGYLAHYGISVEEHDVITDDGYILGTFRLPHHGAPVVLMQHGLEESAWDFMVNSPDIAPAIQIYKMGYDVWLTNNRGNAFSRRHKSMNSTLDKRFWDFSFADLARHDVPANIDYVLVKTGRADLTWVGHSQGTTQLFAAMTNATLKGWLEKRVNLFLALAPAAYMSHVKGVLVKVIADLHLQNILYDVYPYGFLGWGQVDNIAQLFCNITKGAICKLGADIISGTSKEDTPAALTNLTGHFPAGSSVKELVHYAQLILSGKFRDYDYGSRQNIQHYGSKDPPTFDLTQAAKVPTAMLMGSTDKLADPTDSALTIKDLPVTTLVSKHTFQDFSHMTWLVGSRSAFKQWFPVAQDLLQKYNPLGAISFV